MAGLVRRSLLVFAVVSATLATGLAGYWYWNGATGQRQETAGDLGALAGDFSLLDQDGRRRDRQDFAGKYLFVYFGFASCVQGCPQALAAMTLARGRLPGAARARLQPILISVDPLRDTPPVLKAYLRDYDPAFVGLTGSDAEVAAAAAAFHLPYRPPQRQDDGSYRVDHASGIYLVAPDGTLLRLFDPLLDSDALAQALRGLVTD